MKNLDSQRQAAFEESSFRHLLDLSAHDLFDHAREYTRILEMAMANATEENWCEPPCLGTSLAFNHLQDLLKLAQAAQEAERERMEWRVGHYRQRCEALEAGSHPAPAAKQAA